MSKYLNMSVMITLTKEDDPNDWAYSKVRGSQFGGIPELEVFLKDPQTRNCELVRNLKEDIIKRLLLGPTYFSRKEAINALEGYRITNYGERKNYFGKITLEAEIQIKYKTLT